ncbi:general transcription factor 3C polypeptide 5, putative [Plasmodium chabaudi chabaudi]|uniref:General transcription factor 3C polypeptide 5, putative n=1 Tax=Plasmodium chabaudi chabaudi TaxID=31271 RepID=A0A4V0K5G3_PLACU|nr:general transcription factor 3C polypeptide 5, putative [Plasmodium chabaudi chabaudi]VTZ67703.1 general transcription factor 3C polypeptide 5, putative [Plasmodium chabaudi chabaudi]|eukprot:XP_016653425.1 general transcription factor 3C polypeptide 5, putative [Plasmodium chabaudi chabaudi]
MYSEYDIKNENNKCFVDIKRKKDRNKNINFEKIKKSNYICVEIPGKVKKGSNGLSAVESLGGLNKITELFKHDENGYENEGQSLILRINNNDIFSSFVSSNCTKVNNILIKIKKTKKNRYKIEFMGFVKYLYYFDGMSDFYYIPSFYNRHNYSTNYIHYLTKDEKEKSKKSKDNKNGNENSKHMFPDSYFDYFFPNNFNLTTDGKNDLFPNQLNGVNYPWNNSVCLDKSQTINDKNNAENGSGEQIDTTFEGPIVADGKETKIAGPANHNLHPHILGPDPLYNPPFSNFKHFDKDLSLKTFNENKELDEYFSDKEKKELYKNILNYKDASNMFDDKNDFNFSSDESEGYELQSCIHSKSTIPYDFKKYKSQKISKYIREYKYLISKFTEPFDSKNEIKNEDLENFIKKLIINKNEKDHDLPSQSAQFQFAAESVEKEKDLEKRSDKLHINNNLLYNDKYMDQNIFNDSSDSNEIRKGKENDNQNDNQNDSSDGMNKIIVSKKTVHCNPIANFNDPIYPTIPYESALKKYVSDELYNRVKCLFDIRPIWSKEVLVEHLENVTTYCLKSCFSKVCFYFANGPWRRTYCRYGYDPRNDPSSYIYQTIDFRDNYYRDINTKNIEEMNKPIIKKKNILDQTITNIIKNINEGNTNFSNFSNFSSDNYSYTNKESIIRIKRENIGNSDFNNYENETSNMGPLSTSNAVQDNFKTSVNTPKNKKNIEPNNNNLHIKFSHEEDEEINEILKFLKGSNSFHLRKKFSSEIHFCVSPLKLSTIYQYIDIFDNNVLNYLSSIKTQDVCTKDNGWISNKDIANIRDILFVKSMTLRQAHTK